MKKLLMLLVLASAMPLASMAQDDDVYFTPSKAPKEVEKAEKPTYYSGSNRDVDEYNRRGQLNSWYQKIGSDSLGNDIITFQGGPGVYPDSVYGDTAYVYPGSARFSNDDDYTYTRRMSRWDGYYDPWFYSNYYYGPWRYGWYDPWYDPWYYGYAGWYDPWFYGYGGWYDPWYYGYRWGYPYYGGWYGPYWGGGYVAYRGGRNSGGYTGTRTWSSGRDYGNSGTRTWSGNGSGRYPSRNVNRTNTFGSRIDNNRTYSSPANTRSYSGSSSFGGFSGGGHIGGGGFSGGGSFGGGHAVGGFSGGGHFGGRR